MKESTALPRFPSFLVLPLVLKPQKDFKSPLFATPTVFLSEGLLTNLSRRTDFGWQRLCLSFSLESLICRLSLQLQWALNRHNQVIGANFVTLFLAPEVFFFGKNPPRPSDTGHRLGSCDSPISCCHFKMSGQETFGRHDTLSNAKIRHLLKRLFVGCYIESVLLLDRNDWAVGEQVLVFTLTVV